LSFQVAIPVRIEATRSRTDTEYNCESLIALDLVHGLRFVSQCRDRELELPREVISRFQRIGQIDPSACIAAEAVSGLVGLESDLQVRDGIRGHHQFVTMQPRQQVIRDILVPKLETFVLSAAFGFPLLGKGVIDESECLH
jgi:hypothetical protein